MIRVNSIDSGLSKLAWMENVAPALDSSPALKKLVERTIRRTVKHQINDKNNDYRSESEVVNNVPSSNRQVGLNKEVSSRGDNIPLPIAGSETYPRASERGLPRTSGDTEGTTGRTSEREVLDFIRVRDI